MSTCNNKDVPTNYLNLDIPYLECPVSTKFSNLDDELNMNIKFKK